MIGILHHSPIMVSVLVDRDRFRVEFVSEEDVRSGVWQDKIAELARPQRKPARPLVLFVEKLATLQAMLADGLEADQFKVGLFDDCDVLRAAPSVDLVDAGKEGEVWKIYALLPELLNGAIASTEKGVPEETAAFDPATARKELPPAARSIPAVPEGESDSKTLEMRQADAVMRSMIAGDEEPQSPAEPPSVGDSEEKSDTPPQATPKQPEEDPEPPPPPSKKPKKKKKKKKKKRSTKAKPKEPTSCKLF